MKRKRTRSNAKNQTINEVPVMAKEVSAKPSRTTAAFIQYNDKEMDMNVIYAKADEIWERETQKSKEEIVDMKIYVKPQENRAYFVINEEFTGCVEL